MTEADPTRRLLLGAFAAAGLAAPAFQAGLLAAGEPSQELEAAFRAAFATEGPAPLDPKRRLAFLAPNALVIDHDVPFPMTAAAYADHLAFHAGNWERHEWLPYELTTKRHGASGVVSCSYTERGKPKDAGFRLRAGTCMAMCALDRGRWQAIGLAMSPLSAQVLDASPG